ncbi:MAG: hypothetical protein M2R45_04145 [Verrucomicrobia subdivision 3 bacterium]|nr:hypothetical protein [Limisphaerales bacterium]MCS1417716.1 hypothetical protein [Limisphaerales bacterium]
MNQTEAPSLDYSLVITSCGRFDLLRRTVASFLKFADIKPRQYIIVEDSGDESVREILAPFDAPFEILINQPNTGQRPSLDRLNAAIDRGYAQVRFPYIFHCQDDWEFFRSGFIRESFILLNALPKTSVIMLRGRDYPRPLTKIPVREINGVRFCQKGTSLRKSLFDGYSFNPGLRRLTDYQKLAPFSKFKGGEAEVLYKFLKLGFIMAHLEIPAVAHIGWEQRSPRRQVDKRILQKLKKRLMRLHLVARWFLSQFHFREK